MTNREDLLIWNVVNMVDIPREEKMILVDRFKRTVVAPAKRRGWIEALEWVRIQVDQHNAINTFTLSVPNKLAELKAEEAKQ